MEASIVAVRRGMERQYGTGAHVHRWGRSVRGAAAALAYERRSGAVSRRGAGQERPQGRVGAGASGGF
ncbi:hypothetical protein GCM10018987_63150 [Streptomyces cremeus]